MDRELRVKCQAIIHSAASSAAAISGCSSQLPCADNVALSAIEVAMVMAIGKVFGTEISKSTAMGITSSQAATVFGRCASQLLIGWIPVAGNIVNSATAASIVESLGWYTVKKFSNP